MSGAPLFSFAIGLVDIFYGLILLIIPNLLPFFIPQTDHPCTPMPTLCPSCIPLYPLGLLLYLLAIWLVELFYGQSDWFMLPTTTSCTPCAPLQSTLCPLTSPVSSLCPFNLIVWNFLLPIWLAEAPDQSQSDYLVATPLHPPCTSYAPTPQLHP